MARVLAPGPEPGLPTRRDTGLPALLRDAWYLLCDAADTSEMLVISLLTGGAATAAACALASVVLWSLRSARGALARAGRRRASANVRAWGPMA